MPRKRQNIGISFDIMPTGTGVALDSATSAWVAAVIANGGTVSPGRQTLVNNLIVGLKSDGVWSKLDRLWVFADENHYSALTDMVALQFAIFGSNPPTFTVDQGYTGNGVDMYINTQVNLSSYGGQFTTNSGHISAWSTVDNPQITPIMLVSDTSGTTNQTSIYPKYTDGNAYLRCNEGTPSGGAAVATSQGHYVSNRSGASASQGYRNGSNIDNPNVAAGTIPDLVMLVLSGNDSTLGTQPSTYQCSQASIGANLSATDVTNFYNRLRTYMTAVGVP